MDHLLYMILDKNHYLNLQQYIKQLMDLHILKVLQVLQVHFFVNLYFLHLPFFLPPTITAIMLIQLLIQLFLLLFKLLIEFLVLILIFIMSLVYHLLHLPKVLKPHQILFYQALLFLQRIHQLLILDYNPRYYALI